MSKAILELEMPPGCDVCPLCRHLLGGIYVCSVSGKEAAEDKRRSDCPLKEVGGVDNENK